MPTSSMGFKKNDDGDKEEDSTSMVEDLDPTTFTDHDTFEDQEGGEGGGGGGVIKIYDNNVLQEDNNLEALERGKNNNENDENSKNNNKKEQQQVSHGSNRNKSNKGGGGGGGGGVGVGAGAAAATTMSSSATSSWLLMKAKASSLRLSRDLLDKYPYTERSVLSLVVVLFLFIFGMILGSKASNVRTFWIVNVLSDALFAIALIMAAKSSTWLYDAILTVRINRGDITPVYVTQGLKTIPMIFNNNNNNTTTSDNTDRSV